MLTLRSGVITVYLRFSRKRYLLLSRSIGECLCAASLGVRTDFSVSGEKPGRDPFFHHIYKGLGFFVDWRIKQH